MSTLGYKPNTCNLCPLWQKGYGFLGDSTSPHTKIAVLWEQPSEDAIIHSDPLAGRGEDGWLYYNVVMQGFQKSDVAVFHVRHCYQHPRAFVTERDKKGAVEACRQYDQSLRDWKPDTFIISYDLGKHFEAPTLTQIIRAHVRNAFRLAAEGRKPMILCGEAASRLLAPHLIDAGGIKNWHGHWWEGDWPFAAKAAKPTFVTRPPLIIPTFNKPKKDEQLSLL